MPAIDEQAIAQPLMDGPVMTGSHLIDQISLDFPDWRTAQR